MDPALSCFWQNSCMIYGSPPCYFGFSSLSMEFQLEHLLKLWESDLYAWSTSFFRFGDCFIFQAIWLKLQADPVNKSTQTSEKVFSPTQFVIFKKSWSLIANKISMKSRWTCLTVKNDWINPKSNFIRNYCFKINKSYINIFSIYIWFKPLTLIKIVTLKNL